jgi:hypothetical protein
MPLAYLTTDEVNEALAPELADTCGVALEPLVPEHVPPDAGYRALLIDWDLWPPEEWSHASNRNRSVSDSSSGLKEFGGRANVDLQRQRNGGRPALPIAVCRNL